MMIKDVSMSPREAVERQAAMKAKRLRDQQVREQAKLKQEQDRQIIIDKVETIAAELLKRAKENYVRSGNKFGEAEKYGLPADPYKQSEIRLMRRELKKSLRELGLRHFRLIVEADDEATSAILVIRRLGTS